ncbi:unhealthy ribosome biogenesis protein 2 homolog isoform X3 [Nyctibius grandis]|uniref:unhealthy ribosome biogenesis protein 2 homolog isoform X3 n=1 Tax=Nyctibius grandis TaxID=48427 RepID=UPI0035BBC9F0
MAAIYSGIYLKLKSAKTSWEDKLKLARFAWISHQCVLPNKEQVLLDWVSHALVSYYNKKPDLEDEVVEKLWAYLDNVIHSRRLQNLLKSGKTIGLSFSIAQVINERLSEACSQKPPQNVGTVLSCSSGILSTPSLSIIYTAKCELLVDLLSKLSKLACQQLASDDAVGSQVFGVLQLTFAQYLLIQRQQTNPNRVFGQVTSHLLQPCLLLRHLLTVRSWTQADDNHVRQHLSREIRNQVETLLQAGLFQPELFSSYKEELLPEQELQEKKKGALKSLLLPVNTVQTKLGSGFCEPALHAAVVAGSVSLLYKLFLDQYCKAENHLVCFHMLSRLFGCLRLSGLQQDVREDMLSPADWSTELLALEQLLNLVLSSDIYNVASDRIRHKDIQFGFYRKLAQMLLGHSQASIPAWFRCLKLLISLNHLVVEPDLDDLVASAWIDAEVSEPRTKKPQEALINTMFQTYSKLRQFPRLFEEVLKVICQPAADELRLPVFSAGLTVKLRECLLELPTNQILDILCLFVEKCQTLIIPAVEGSDDMALKLLSVSSVLHAFLFNMRSLDDATPSPVVLRAQSLLAKMQKGIIQPLMELLQAPRREEEMSDLWLRKASDSGLLLVYTWIEVDTLFGVSCSPAVTTQVIQSMEMELTEVLVQLLGNCSAEEFYTIMRLVLQGLEMKNVWHQKAKEVLSAVTLTKLLLSCPLSGDKEKAFWFASPQIITALAMQTKEACQDQSLISTIVIPILETVAALLRQGEGVLLNPHHVSLAFSILLTVPLDRLKTEDYRSVFLGIHEVLFSIVQCHPKVLLKAAPSFLNSFHRLVVSVMHEGRQKGDRGNTDEFEVILKCAHLVERMYTYIAAEMEDFTVFSAFIVAQYVTELQKVTLHPAVKKHLTEGIYHILDLCIERDIKFLNASLPAGVREVFKDLYGDYNHYHKAKRHGEEKYTA